MRPFFFIYLFMYFTEHNAGIDALGDLEINICLFFLSY